MTSRRAQLSGAGTSVPLFDLTLPPGWRVTALDDLDEDRPLDRALARLKAAGEGDEAALLAQAWPGAVRELADSGVFAFAAPGPGAPDWAVLPASVLAGVRRPSPGDEEGEPLLSARPGFIRRTRAQRTTEQAGRTVGVSVWTYRIAWPEPRAPHMLELTAALAHEAHLDEDTGAARDAWMELIDACVATFRWRGDRSRDEPA